MCEKMCKCNDIKYTFEYNGSNIRSTIYSEVFFVSYFSVEKTIREDGNPSVVLVDDNYQIVKI